MKTVIQIQAYMCDVLDAVTPKLAQSFSFMSEGA